MVRTKISPIPRWCALVIAASAACYNPDFSGLPCQRDAECGPLSCVDGHCGHPAATGSDSTSPTTTTAATLTGQLPTTTSDETTTALTSTTGLSTTTGLATTTGQTSSSESSDATTSQTTSESTGTTAAPDEGPCCDEIDVLFVIDQSTVMHDQCFETNLLIAAAKSSDLIYDVFSKRVTSFHIGFTMASIVPENPPECTGIGSLVQGQPANNCVAKYLGGLPYMTSEVNGTSSDAFWDAVLCILGAGTPGDPPEGFENSRPVEAALWALHPSLNAEGACNHGFARPDAPLLVFLFSNVDQVEATQLPQMFNTPTNWWQLLVSIRAGMAAKDQYGLVSILGPDAPDPDGCTAENPVNIKMFAELFDKDLTRSFDICGIGCDAKDLTAITAFLQESLQTLVCSVCEPTN